MFADVDKRQVGLREQSDAEAERRMETGRLLLRRLKALPAHKRIAILCEHYRGGAIFLIRHRDELSPDVLRRFVTAQGRIERTVRAVRPERRTDVVRKLALRAWRSLAGRSVAGRVPADGAPG